MSRGYEIGPRTAILMLFEEAEDYFSRNGQEQARQTVTEYRSELGRRLIDESYDQLADTDQNQEDM